MNVIVCKLSICLLLFSSQLLGAVLSPKAEKTMLALLNFKLAKRDQQRLFLEYSAEIAPALHSMATDVRSEIPEEYQQYPYSRDHIMECLLSVDDSWAILHFDDYLRSRPAGDNGIGMAIHRASNPKVLPALVERMREELARPIPQEYEEKRRYLLGLTGVNHILNFIKLSPLATLEEKQTANQLGSISIYMPELSQKSKAVVQWWDSLPNPERFTTASPYDPSPFAEKNGDISNPLVPLNAPTQQTLDNLARSSAVISPAISDAKADVFLPYIAIAMAVVIATALAIRAARNRKTLR